MKRQSVSHAHPQRNQSTNSGASKLLALAIFLSATWAMTRGLWATEQAAPLLSTTLPPATTAPATEFPVASVTPVPTSFPSTDESPAATLPIGIVAGHMGNDSGAVCDDWLQEVDINTAIATRIVQTLRELGYSVDLLEEFDPRLEGYRGRVLLSIHADACLYPEASGFKVARVEDSAVPGLEDQLVACIASRYGTRTGMAFHEGSITADMTHYHTFYEIDQRTPGAIIEVGFMLADRDMLLNHQDLLAQGIVEGILCFLRGESP